MYKLVIAPRAKKELKAIAKLQHRQAIITAIEELKDDPYAGKPLLRELTGKYTYRVGAFRIIYTINPQNKTVNLLTAGHRSHIYN